MKLQNFNLKSINEMDSRYRAAFINSLSGFKSCNLISTINSSGQTNLALFSSCVHLGSTPPLFGLISRPASVERHTFENIIEMKKFTINHVNSSIIKNAHQTSARYDRDISEFDEAQLTKEYINDFPVSFVKESLIKMAMELVEVKTIEVNQTEFLIAKLVEVHLPESILSEDGHINIEDAKSITVSGLDHYHNTESLMRLSYAKPNKWPVRLKK